VFWYLYNESGRFKNIHISSFENLEKKKFNFVAFFRHMNLFLLLVGLTFVILALARPHLPSDIDEYQKKNMEGIDIVLAIDASGSMKAQDFKPNRLEAAKEVAINFIDERPADRIGLVVFQAEAYTQAPLTTDHELLKSLFTEVQNSAIITDGTAIGEGLATAINRLRESDAKSKVIILLTDGVNNSGDTDPLTAANVAKENNICVYTIGVGKDGTAPYPVETPFGTMMQEMPVEIDEELMTQIAEYTGGKYYRAKNETELEKIYDEIDQLEKSKVKVLEFKVNPPEKYYGLLLLGIFLILFHRTVQHTFLKSIP
jgi:Ca-activated chloride channel family protein